MYKLENVELIDTLRNIVNAVTNAYKTDYVYDASTIRNSEENYFLFMPREMGVVCADIEHAFTDGTSRNNSWEHYKNSSEYKKAFLVHVNDRAGKEVYGSVYEIDYNKSLEDIKRYKQPCEIKEITFANGNKLQYESKDFDDNRYEIQERNGGAIHYNDIPANRNILNTDIAMLVGKYVDNCKPIEPEEYFKNLHSERFQYHLDVLHVPDHDVYKLLTETNIPVYDVSSLTPVQLTLDLYKKNNTDYNNPHVYAINPKSKGKYDDFDKKVFEYNVKQYELENKKYVALIKYGYKSGDRYLLEGKEIDKAFELGTQVYALHTHRGGYSSEIYKIDAAKEFIKNSGLVGISTNDKKDFLKALKEDKLAKRQGISGRIATAKVKAAVQDKAPVDNALNRESEAR
jgi:hypothetical protein